MNLVFYLCSGEVLRFWKPPWSVDWGVLVPEETDFSSKDWKEDSVPSCNQGNSEREVRK